MGKFSDYVKRKLNPRQAAIDEMVKPFGLKPGARLSTVDELMQRTGNNAYFIRTTARPYRYMHFIGETADEVAYGLQDSKTGACVWGFNKAIAFVKEFEGQPGQRTDIEIVRLDQDIDTNANS